MALRGPVRPAALRARATMTSRGVLVCTSPASSPPKPVLHREREREREREPADPRDAGRVGTYEEWCARGQGSVEHGVDEGRVGAGSALAQVPGAAPGRGITSIHCLVPYPFSSFRPPFPTRPQARRTRGQTSRRHRGPAPRAPTGPVRGKVHAQHAFATKKTAQHTAGTQALLFVYSLPPPPSSTLPCPPCVALPIPSPLLQSARPHRPVQSRHGTLRCRRSSARRAVCGPRSRIVLVFGALEQGFIRTQAGMGCGAGDRGVVKANKGGEGGERVVWRSCM